MPVRMKAAGAAFAVAVAVTIAGAGAWACVPGGAGGGSGKKLTVSPEQVRPGDQVTVSAPSSAAATPIEIRLNAADGPLLGSISTAAPSAGRTVSTAVTVPPDTMPGQNALIAIQAGQRWNPVALPVALPDGTVPDSMRSAAQNNAQDGAGGRRTFIWAIIGVAVLGMGAIAVRATSHSRRGRRHASPSVDESTSATAPTGSLPIHVGDEVSSNAARD